jgi:hypothetical protein
LNLLPLQFVRLCEQDSGGASYATVAKLVRPSARSYSSSRLLDKGAAATNARKFASWFVVGNDLLRVTAMAHFAWPTFDKAHPVRDAVDRVETAVVISLIGLGLLACALGAVVYDVGRLVSAFH